MMPLHSVTGRNVGVRRAPERWSLLVSRASNSSGQLGRPTPDPDPQPATVEGLTGAQTGVDVQASRYRVRDCE